MRLEDFTDCMHPAKPTKPGEEPQSKKIVEPITASYTFRDNAVEFDENGFPFAQTEAATLARSVITENQSRFFIRQNGNGMLYDPMDLYSNPKSHKQDLVKDGSIDFREVNDTIFRYYLLFLKTGNKARLKKANEESR